MPENVNSEIGRLLVSVTSSVGFIPIKNATVKIYAERQSADQERVLVETLNTNESGQTDRVDLPTPPRSLSQEPSEIRPYAEYDMEISAEGYEPVSISGSEVMSDELAVQNVEMNPLEEPNLVQSDILIPDHTLYGEYEAKIPEEEIKEVNESGEIVLSRVVIPEYVVVHDGRPEDRSAKNYYVRYKDYIKNVASSEIYSTWPEQAIYANVLCIMSFTLNRVYTEFYRGKGYDFTITSNTAFDQKWIYGRNIYENISYVVDSIFNNYLSRPGVNQPIFTSYCDGNRVTCKGLSQWGSKYLADQGYSAIEIIRYYYGNDMFINSTNYISGIPSSYPGYDLTVGSRGAKVLQMQQQLNRIAQNYPAIPKIAADGIFGVNTKRAVQTFQGIFLLPQSGIVDYPTWYQISNVYVAVTRIAEPG
ncbi:MAG: peptidoglycan-binding protein [Lachnospiraceae bacterium]|nr:peptidoglycan-binding protein [Lachnospiraceae bacterium]